MMRIQIKKIQYNIVISIFLLFFLLAFNLKNQYEIMFAYSIVCLLSYSSLIYNEIRNFNGIKINILLLMAIMMRFVLPLFNKAIEGMQFDKISLGEEYDISNSIFETSILMDVYYAVLYMFFCKYSNNVYLEDYIKPYLKKYNVSFIAILLFTIGTIYNIVTSYIPNTFIPYSIANILGSFSMMAILLQLLNASIFHTSRKEHIFVILIIVEILRCFLWGFMKGPIMYAFSFYVLYVLLRARHQGRSIITGKNIFLVVFAFVFLTYVVSPFIAIKRDTAQWDIASGGIVGSSYSNMDILKDVFSGKYEKEEKRTNAIDRLDALSNNAFFVDYTNRKGSYNFEFINESIHELTPRFLNANKHPSRKGLMATSIFKYGNTANYDSVLSNSYIGQTASAYMIGGILMVFFLAIVNGFILSKYYIFLIRNINNLFAALFLVQLLILSLTGFEEVHDGGLLRCSLFIIYIILISILNKFHLFVLSAKKS